MHESSSYAKKVARAVEKGTGEGSEEKIPVKNYDDYIKNATPERVKGEQK
jgi:hypothetical protein